MMEGQGEPTPSLSPSQAQALVRLRIDCKPPNVNDSRPWSDAGAYLTSRQSVTQGCKSRVPPIV